MELNNSNFEGLNIINQDITTHEEVNGIVNETSPEQDFLLMKKAFAKEKGVSEDDILDINGHFVVKEGATMVHTKDDGTVN